MKHLKYPDIPSNLPESEVEVLKFWKDNDVFKKSVAQRQGEPEFVFYDGPPFANGLPHYGHLLTGFIKDVFARYQTMKGKKVERKFGWDTHGLPVEMEVEKELGVSGQIAIQEYGIAKFNQACERSVMKYAGEWKNYVERQGRWVDFDNGYKTMDINYMESVIWAFKKLCDQGLVYEDFRVVPYSWACQTPLSNFETRMDNAYRMKESKAVTVAFKLTSIPASLQIGESSTVKLVAWTTTPWTLPSNLALAVGSEIEYTAFRKDNEILIVASAALAKFKPAETDIITKFKGEKLLELSYEPLFPYFSKLKEFYSNCFTVLAGDFVNTDEGTGVVHIAPGFGEDDQMLAKLNKIPTVCPVDEGGKFSDWAIDDQIFSLATTGNLPELKGKQVFETNDDIIKYLKQTGAWLKTEQYLHNYPHCWRTDTPLIYRAVSSWYVEVSAFKDRMIELNHGQELFPKLDGFYTRSYKDEDFEHIYNLRSNPDVQRFHPNGVYSKNQAKSYFNELKSHHEKHRFSYLPVFEEGTHKFVGICGLMFVDPKQENFERGEVEIGYALMPEFWGRGIATKLAGEFVKWARKTLKVRKITALVRTVNVPSIKVLTKLNFKFIKLGINPRIGDEVEFHEIQFDDEEFDPITLESPAINWIPEHIRDGQFGRWIANARDWSITRNRFWGCPVPVWKSDDPNYPRLDVYGSLDDIERDFGVRPENLHRPYIDELVRKNPDDPTGKSMMRRVTDVLDCWFESGSMPYAQAHYPFENKQWFEENFPADFVTEYLAQTRGWFYTMMVLATALFDKVPFKNVICHGTILDEKSQKLSKRLKNYADPLEIFSTIGSDAMRFYMLSQPVMNGQELRIDKDGKAVRDTFRLSIKPLLNAYSFFCLYANTDQIKAERLDSLSKYPANLLDRYILAKLKSITLTVDTAMAKYDTVTACAKFDEFFEVLNNWYIRRNRQRYWKNEIDQDKRDAYNVLYTVLLTTCEVFAPLLPFTTEIIWRALKAPLNLSN